MVGNLDTEVRADGSVTLFTVRPHIFRLLARGLLLAGVLGFVAVPFLLSHAVEHLWWQVEVGACACLVGAAALWRFQTGSRGRRVLTIDPGRDVIQLHGSVPTWLDPDFVHVRPSKLKRVEVRTTHVVHTVKRFDDSVSEYQDEETLALVSADDEPMTVVRADRNGRASDLALALHEATGVAITRTESAPRAEDWGRSSPIRI